MCAKLREVRSDKMLSVWKEISRTKSKSLPSTTEFGLRRKMTTNRPTIMSLVSKSKPISQLTAAALKTNEVGGIMMSFKKPLA